MSGDDLAQAKQRDQADPLRSFRDQFVIADEHLIYLDGNSLGRAPKQAASLARTVVDHWGTELVAKWRDWFGMPQRLGAKVAQLIGAKPNEVIVCDSTSVNLYKLTVAALRANPDRKQILTDDANFPSDVYVSAGIPEGSLDIVPCGADPEAAILAKLNPTTALLSLSHTHFKSGYTYDMRRLTQAAHDTGALALWDLSHSAGAMPIDLNGCNVDLAIGCGYKYLNGGPGAPAYLYVREDLQSQLQSPIWGWFGAANPFDFSLHYEPVQGIARFLAGTPAVLSMAMMEPGLDLAIEAGMDRLRAKSLDQTAFLMHLVEQELVPLGFQCVTPKNPDRRGSHVALQHPDAWRINQALIAEAKVIPDFRAPNVIRFGVTPLTTTYEELVLAVDRTKQIMNTSAYKSYPEMRSAVT